jgi:hypothetical protein
MGDESEKKNNEMIVEKNLQEEWHFQQDSLRVNPRSNHQKLFPQLWDELYHTQSSLKEVEVEAERKQKESSSQTNFSMKQWTKRKSLPKNCCKTLKKFLESNNS